MLNTVNDQLLRDVSVEIEIGNEDVWELESSIPLAEAAYGEKGSCYVCLHHCPDSGYEIVPIATEVRETLLCC